MNQTMTKGSPLSLILLFALPLLAGTLVQQFYNICDTAITGHLLGDGALAAIGATSAIAPLIIYMCNGMNNGFSLLVSSAFGSGNEALLKMTTAILIELNLALALSMTALSLVLIRPLMTALSVPAPVFEDAYGYISIILAGLPATLCYNASASLLRAVGNSKTPLIFLVIASGLNIALDVLFVAGFGWGVRGAAFATVLAQCVSGVLCVVHIIRRYPIFRLRREHWLPDWNRLTDMFTTGLSMGLMLSIFQIGSVILQGAINLLGPAYITAQIGGRKLMEMAMNPFFALSQSTATYVSQNYGAGDRRRIGEGMRVIMALSLLWSTIAVALLWLPAPLWMRLLTGSTDSVVIASGTDYLRVGMPLFYPLSFLLMYRNALQAMGHRIAPVIGSVMELAGKVLFSAVIVPAIGYMGVCLCEPVLWVVCMVFMMGFSWVHREEFGTEIARRKQSP